MLVVAAPGWVDGMESVLNFSAAASCVGTIENMSNIKSAAGGVALLVRFQPMGFVFKMMDVLLLKFDGLHSPRRPLGRLRFCRWRTGLALQSVLLIAVPQSTAGCFTCNAIAT